MTLLAGAGLKGALHVPQPLGFNFLRGVKVVDLTQFEAGDPGRRLRPGQPDDDPYYWSDGL